MKNVSRKLVPLLVMLLFVGSAASQTNTTFVPEKVTAVQSVPPGPKIYVSDGRKVDVLDADTLKFYGTLLRGPGYGSGWRGQFVFGNDPSLVYMTNTYYSHGSESSRHDVIELWNLSTLTPLQEEIEIPAKTAMRGSDKILASVSPQGDWMFVQNATPAQSVSVINLQARKFSSEIPITGCWGVYPFTKSDVKFFSLCGDGTFVTTEIDTSGNKAQSTKSQKIFDADVDPLFTAYGNNAMDFYMVSYKGSVYHIRESSTGMSLKDTFSISGDTGWVPGGDQLLAYAPEYNILYVLMHKAEPGKDHTSPAEELWAVDLKNKKIVSRTTVSSPVGLTYLKTAAGPSLYMNDKNSGELVKYVIDPMAGFTARVDKKEKLEIQRFRAEARL